MNIVADFPPDQLRNWIYCECVHDGQLDLNGYPELTPSIALTAYLCCAQDDAREELARMDWHSGINYKHQWGAYV